MAWCDRPSIVDYLTNFTGQDPVKAVACPFAQDSGAGIGLGLFSMFFFTGIGLGLAVRVQHPGPLLVAAILNAGIVTLAMPGIALKVLALIMVIGISALGVYLYQRAQGSL